MNCNVDEIRWLMEWAAFLVVIVLFAAAAAWRWAQSPKPINPSPDGGA